MRFASALLCVFVGAMIPACECSGPGAGGVGGHRDGGAGANTDSAVDGGPNSMIDGGPNSAHDGGPGSANDSGILGDDAGAGCGPREICNNGLDDNCNGAVDENCGCSVGQTQACYAGSTTVAGVGACRRGQQTCEASGEFSSWGMCSGQIAPGLEQCDGTEDEDCDGTVDEGCGCPIGTSRDCYTGAASTLGIGPCHGGTQLCVAMGTTTDWAPCSGQVTPGPEICDGMDYDCDGVANTGCDCALGATRSCYDGPTGSSGVGICHDGAQTCVAAVPGPGAMWGSCDGEQLPATDMCDGIDYTCTGVAGAGCACILGATRPCYGGTPATRGVGRCHDGTNACVAGPMWSGTCGSEQQPVTEVCANGMDDDCDALVDEGCGGTIMCPGNQTVPAGTPINLTPGMSGLVSYSWTIVSAPTGGAATAVWAPTPPTAMTEAFTPYIVGDYVIRITGTDAGGHVVTCMFTVTALPHGLRVQLTWDGSGDIDLHLHNQVTTSPWFTSPNDCYFGDLAPAWGATQDFDNTVSNGPENISMNNPVIGTPYTVAVHNWARGAGRVATVQIFCGSTMSTTPTATFMSHPLVGAGSGTSSPNDFWTVARITFTSATTCTVDTSVARYRTATAAAAAF